MPAANPTTVEAPLPLVGFTIQETDAPRPDPEAIARFDALLQGLDPETASRLLRDCLAEIALWQHHLRVQESRYAGNDARPRELFHIG